MANETNETNETNKTMNLSWIDVENACIDVSHKISESHFKPDIILPVLWGGIIPARIIMDILNINRLDCKPIYARSYKDCKAQKDIRLDVMIPSSDYITSRALIIEEIVDSGRTIDSIIKYLESYGFKKSNIKVATLTWRNRKGPRGMPSPNSYPIPDFHSIELDDEWVIFPWDKQEYMRGII